MKHFLFHHKKKGKKEAFCLLTTRITLIFKRPNSNQSTNELNYNSNKRASSFSSNINSQKLLLTPVRSHSFYQADSNFDGILIIDTIIPMYKEKPIFEDDSEDEFEYRFKRIQPVYKNKIKTFK